MGELSSPENPDGLQKKDAGRRTLEQPAEVGSASPSLPVLRRPSKRVIELSGSFRSLGTCHCVLRRLAGTPGGSSALPEVCRDFRCAVESSGGAQNFRVPHRIFPRLVEFCRAPRNLRTPCGAPLRLSESSEAPQNFAGVRQILHGAREISAACGKVPRRAANSVTRWEALWLSGRFRERRENSAGRFQLPRNARKLCTAREDSERCWNTLQRAANL